MSAYVIDTETTDIENPQVIQLGLMGPLMSPLSVGTAQLLQFKPTRPISLGARATHHILDEELADCPPWAGFALPSHCAYLIGHNVDFDWKAIGSPNVKRICTLALARHLWPTNDSHSLGACIYHICAPRMAKDLLKNAHSAAADVDLCMRLLGHLCSLLDEPETWEALWLISEAARIPKLFTFGKHKGAAIADIRRRDPSYISWCLSGKCDLVNEDQYLRQALTQ